MHTTTGRRIRTGRFVREPASRVKGMDRETVVNCGSSSLDAVAKRLGSTARCNGRRPFMLDTVHVTSPSSRAHAVQARPKQEERAAMNLVSGGVTTPPMLAGAQNACAPSARPLFPRYLFVQCDIAWSVQRISTRGVAKVPA